LVALARDARKGGFTAVAEQAIRAAGGRQR
jgi:hypothetical protein